MHARHGHPAGHGGARPREGGRRQAGIEPGTYGLEVARVSNPPYLPVSNMVSTCALYGIPKLGRTPNDAVAANGMG